MKDIQNIIRRNGIPIFKADRIIVIFSLILQIHFFFLVETFAQATAELKMEPLCEELFIRTDRDIYIAGEEMWLKIFKVNRLTGKPDDMSKVVYVELLNRNNYPVRQIKIRTDSCSASSVLIIPGELTTGNYLLRAYTQWMQNWPAGIFATREISVINPFSFTDHPPAAEKLALKPQAAAKNDNTSTGCSLQLDKENYSCREKISAGITVTNSDNDPVKADLSVSVVRSALMKNGKGDSFFTGSVHSGNESRTNPEFLPELEGHLVSGTIKLRSTGAPMGMTAISLSPVGKISRCQFTNTDEIGRFHFVANGYGSEEIVIQPVTNDKADYYIELGLPFSSRFAETRISDFRPDSNSLAELNKAVIAIQVRNIYATLAERTSAEDINLSPDFYGTPDKRIIIGDFIELSSVREVVKEIIPDLITDRQNDEYEFKLVSKFRGQLFENKPLVLVDGVPVKNIGNILEISSKEIEWVDLINTRYFLSENVFDGIVSFVTVKGNLSVMEFDNSGFRQVYDFCEEPESFTSPDHGATSTQPGRIPDFRNTLYWNPDLTAGPDGKAEFSFFTSDEKGEFTITIAGLTSDGEKIYSTRIINVR